MTRRLILAIVGTTIAALALAGAGTLLLATVRARQSTEADLRNESRQLARTLARAEATASNGPFTPARRALVRAVVRALKLEDVSIMTFGPQGRTTDAPPDGVTLDDLDTEALLGGSTVSGAHGSLVYAASASKMPTGGSLVAVVTREADTGLRPAARWFVLAGFITVALGAGVAVLLGRRLTRPVREVDDAAHRIAAGELSTRLPEPPANATDELADLVRSINAMAASLERSRGVEHQFLLSVSHDLRTPLTSIRGYAEAISDGATSDPQWAAGVILAEARRLERLVRDLLDLARLQSPAFSLQMQPVDLSGVARATTGGFAPDAHAAELALTVELAGALLVRGDGDRLAQVVANLVENALRYAHTAVRVATALEGPWAVLTVEDDGPGIAPDDLAHVFERLYVARHEPVRKESGSGLGLAIVRELVDAMGGTVAAEAAPGGGARMVVRLPALPAPVAADAIQATGRP
jgi:two-component system OmpR family sensor kinase